MKLNYLLLFFSLLVACTSARQGGISTFARNVVIAHRGAFKAQNHPENSIAALREAIRLGCTGSEFDVRMSADDSLLINHDPHYQKLEIEKTSYADLSSVRLPNGEVLPTLRQYLLEGMRNNKLTRLVVEIKPSGISKERGQEIGKKALDMVRELKAEHMVVYISFDYEILKKLRQLDPSVQLQYLNGDRSPIQLKEDRINGADYHLSVFQKNPGWIGMARENGIVLNAWTVNTREDMQWLLERKFDFITTNEPELLLQLQGVGQNGRQ